MISLPFRRSRRPATIDALYGTIVARARSPAFYRRFGVPDTVGGRMDMIILHLMLVMRQLRTGPNPSSPAGSFAQQLFDRFCEDMDDNFREMGVGDLAVPKEMRAVGEAFYGRVRAYEAALAADDDRALAAALSRNVFGGTANPDDPPLGAWRLATYMKDAAARLEVQAAAGALMDGRIDFPDPEVMPQEPSNEQAPT